MIDTHLEALGINSKIPPVSLLSDKFLKEVGNVGKNPKSKASEMEHASEKHIKLTWIKTQVFINDSWIEWKKS